MYDFEKIIDRKNNGSKKWNLKYIEKRFPNHKEEIYPLFIADMDYRLPKEIMDNFNRFISNGDFGYFDVDEEFYEEIIKWHKEKNKVFLEKADIITGIGTITTLSLAMAAILNKGDKVIIFTPVYGPFKEIIEKNGFEMVKEDLIEKEMRYNIDFKSLEEKFKDGVRSILFCNPQNPSGRVWGKDEIVNLMSLCKKYNVMIFSDEVHSDLMLYKNEFTSFSKYFKEYENIIISTSPNKTFNLAGIGASYLIVRKEEYRNNINKYLEDNRIEINRIGAEFIKIAYKHGEYWLKELKANLEDNIEIAKEQLKELNLEIMEVDSSYLLWIKLKDIDDTLEFSRKLARETGVLVETGSRFIDNYSGYIRINIGTSKRILKEGLQRFSEYYKTLK